MIWKKFTEAQSEGKLYKSLAMLPLLWIATILMHVNCILYPITQLYIFWIYIHKNQWGKVHFLKDKCNLWNLWVSSQHFSASLMVKTNISSSERDLWKKIKDHLFGWFYLIKPFWMIYRMFAHEDLFHYTLQFLKWFSDCLYFCLLCND